MKVILTNDVEKVGKAGSVVNVKDGFAKNYLIPKSLAVVATTKSMKELEHRKRVVNEKILKERKSAAAVKEAIENLSCTIARPVGEEDKIFGSVTSKDIEDVLTEEGFKIDKKDILLQKPIKNLGLFQVDVKLQGDITAKLKVWVVAK
ncbi:MAG: 50S ribosomal protein L9 [Deltaproteobacteria bacterium]|nr:50S ribosomal protein L9 [Deltaproteobacteria bacterium]